MVFQLMHTHSFTYFLLPVVVWHPGARDRTRVGNVAWTNAQRPRWVDPDQLGQRVLGVSVAVHQGRHAQPRSVQLRICHAVRSTGMSALANLESHCEILLKLYFILHLHNLYLQC